MKNKCLAILSPLCLCLFAGNAFAELEPFTFGASEAIGHQSNLNHTDDSIRTGDWTSVTELNAAVDQALGRDKLVASAAVDFNRYKRTHSLDSTGYRGAAEFDWSTVGDLSGAFGADASRRQYIYGETSEPVLGSPATLVNVRNLQTDTHEFAKIALGGDARWQIYGGADLNQRKYSNDLFRTNDEQQWSSNLGTRYSTSPDLSFGLQGAYTHGEYPHGSVTVEGGASKFSSRSVDLNTQWKASGNSAFDASVGYTSDTSQVLARGRHFANGSVNWIWTPPSHFTVNFGLKRSSDADASTGVNVGVVNQNNLNGTSINNVAHLEVTYSLTAKISIDGSADYTQRKYNNLADLDVDGSTRTTRFYLTAHYQPTRTTDLSCGGGRETRHVDAGITKAVAGFTGYTDNYLQCVASIKFD